MVERAYGDGRYLVEIVPSIGRLGNNAYILSGPSRGKVTLVDAPEGSEAVLEAVGRRTIERIVITHEHDDHWAGIDTLRAATDAPVYAAPPPSGKGGALRELRHGDTFDIGGATARILHTPGHTPGSFCLHFGGAVLTGDTLFPGGPGRTRDNAALQQEIESIKTHLLQLQPDTLVLPGHGPGTTIQKADEEYATFASKPMKPDLSGDVRWLD